MGGLRSHPHLRTAGHEWHHRHRRDIGAAAQRRAAALRDRRHGAGDQERQRRRRGPGRFGVVERARHGAVAR